jgi:protein-tyrosine phosphatase
MKPILFICTGNVFRSVAAEYALRACLPPDAPFLAASAGIEAKPQALHPMIVNSLRAKGADISCHVQRRLNQELLNECHVAIAMGHDHRDFIRRAFGRDVPLFNTVCFGRDEPVLDLHEALPNWQSDLDAAHAYVRQVIDHIWSAAPRLLERLN